MTSPVPPEIALSVACFTLGWSVLSTLLWLYVLLRVLGALESLSRAHAELANALHRIAQRMPAKSAEPVPGPVEADWQLGPSRPRGAAPCEPVPGPVEADWQSRPPSDRDEGVSSGDVAQGQ
jgi:hypothetical protein